MSRKWILSRGVMIISGVEESWWGGVLGGTHDYERVFR